MKPTNNVGTLDSHCKTIRKEVRGYFSDSLFCTMIVFAAYDICMGKAYPDSAQEYGIPYLLTFCSLKHFSSFRRHLKTHYFQSAYPAPLAPIPNTPSFS